MTAERLLLELASDDVPKISSGRFNWRPVEGAANQPKTNGNQIPVPTLAPSPAAAIPLAFRESLGAPTLTSEAFPLNLLENKTFMGTGMNMIWRPRSSTKPSKPIIGDAVVAGGAQDVLQFNMTAESMAFSGSIGEAIPNRGAGDQGDISLQGIPYVQRVGSFEDPAAFDPNEVASSKAKKPEGIHFETGCFMFVPEHKTNGATLNRMASIPHGTTINAQGFVPSQTLIKGKPQKTPRDPLPLDKSAKGPPQTVQKVAATDRAKVADNGGIPAISIVPFNFAQSETKDPADPKKTIATTVPDITKFAEAPDKPDKPVLKLGDEVNFFDETHLKFDESPNNRLPTQWKDFVRNKVLTEKMFRDPNEVLSKAIEDQDIESFCTFTLTTTASDKVKGGGIANIGFLEGPPASRNNGRGNAQPVSVTVTYWIETVRAKLTLKPGVSSQQAFQMINKAGVLGPLFVAPPTTNEKQPISKTVRWTQLQYSQNVTLNFSGLSWPHISVATLGETGTKELDLTPS